MSITAGVGEQLKLVSRHSEPRAYKKNTLVLGSVCYAESISSIWKGMMRHFARHGLDVDFVLFTNYERQVHALLTGDIDIAWNGPLSHARALRLSKGNLVSLGMRDVDRDFTSHIVVREDAGISTMQHLAGRRLACGTVDSPQAYIMPMHAVAQAGVDLSTLTVLRYDRDIGKHGDTAYGEDAVLDALKAGTAEAGFISDIMWQRYVKAGKTEGLRCMPAGSVPSFDHCQFDAVGGRRQLPRELLSAFQQALLAQKMDGSGHFEDTRTMELEGIKETWLPPRGGTLLELEEKAGAADGDKSKAVPDASLGYKGMLSALDLFEEKNVRWPGVLHTPRRHPFKHLMVDYSLIRDANGC